MNDKPKLKTSGSLMEFTITPPKLKSKRKIHLLILVLKSLVCVVGPLTIPTIVYGVEGCTTFFWWVLGMASITSILLLTLDVQKIKNLIEYLKVNQSDRTRCLIKVGLLILMCGGGTYAHHVHFYEIFSVCLFIAGIITGTLISDVTTYRSFRSKHLPYVNFTKDSPKPVRPSFLDLRRKSLNVPSRATNNLPLKRQISHPTKQSSTPVNFLSVEGGRSHVPVSVETPSGQKSPVLFDYPTSSSSSSESDVVDASQQSMDLTPTKRRVITAVNISLSPLVNTAKTSLVSKQLFENDDTTSSISPSQTPSFIYSNCNVENLMSQNFSFFHM